MCLVMDKIGIADNKATDFTRNIRAVLKYIRQAGLKLIMEKGLFGARHFSREQFRQKESHRKPG